MKRENLLLWNVVSRTVELSGEPLDYRCLLEALYGFTNSYSQSKSFIIQCFNNGWLYEVDE